MGKHAGRCKKRYVDCPIEISQLTCLIHGPGHSSDECKVLDNFGTKYAKCRPFKESRVNPTTKKKYKKKQQVNSIVQQLVDYIILQKTEN